VGELRAGQKVLVHAGAGGVGMAAIQIARHLGAEVYATASPAKWDSLRALGLDDDHIASSRDLDFRERFLAATGGEGVDVVLNALAGEFVDASLDLLPRGGRFVELGKADVRDAGEIGRDRPGVEYRAIDLLRSAGPERVGEILAAVLELFERGALRHPPIRAWDVRHAAQAFRHLGDGRNVGKVVLTIPRLLDPEGTVLITGGTGDLGARVARHLATAHDVRQLLLTSRRGPDAPGAGELIDELRGLGAEPSVVACDVTDRDELSALLGAIDPRHSLTAVIHTAGVLDDGVIESLTDEQVERVMRPKVDAALLLDELTRESDLAEFVLFSSDSGTVGVPGQGNYAAANVFLDALAERRRAHGLPAKSLAWGLWSDSTGLAGNLGEADIARLSRLGVAAMSGELDSTCRGCAPPRRPARWLR
jgi:mycoketide-CoA synthase